MAQDHSLPSAPYVLSPETMREVEKLPYQTQLIADRWCLGWKARVKKMEKDGIFLERLKDQARREAEVIAKALDCGHLARHEIMELYGVDPAP